MIGIMYDFITKTPAKCREAFEKEVAKCNKELAKEEKKEAKKKAKKAEKKAKKKAKKVEKQESKKVADQTKEKTMEFMQKCINKIVEDGTDIKSTNAAEFVKDILNTDVVANVVADAEFEESDSENTEEKESDDSDSPPSTAIMLVEEGGNEVLNKLDIIEENISKKRKKKIMKILSKYLDNNKKYKIIDMQDGLYKIYFLSKDRDLIENIIDPFGTINGGNHPRIYKKAITPSGDTVTGFFDLTLDTNLSKVLLNSEDPFIDYDTGMNIPDNDTYNLTIDFSNTPQMDKLDKNKLLNNINFAINSMANAGINIPKFRFSDLSDEDHFTLISDFKVKLPLQYESVKINGVDTPLGFNKFIDNGRVLLFDNGNVYTYNVNNPNNKQLLAQLQPQQQQQNPNQFYNNIMNSGMGEGFIPNPTPIITT